MQLNRVHDYPVIREKVLSEEYIGRQVLMDRSYPIIEIRTGKTHALIDAIAPTWELARKWVEAKKAWFESEDDEPFGGVESVFTLPPRLRRFTYIFEKNIR